MEKSKKKPQLIILHVDLMHGLYQYNNYNKLFADSSGLRTVGKVSQEELTSWERLGEGGFSSVYKAKLKGNDVAVKVLKNLEETKPLLTEGNLLRYVQ